MVGGTAGRAARGRRVGSPALREETATRDPTETPQARSTVTVATGAAETAPVYTGHPTPAEPAPLVVTAAAVTLLRVFAGLRLTMQADMAERALGNPLQGVLLTPGRPNGLGVVVLGDRAVRSASNGLAFLPSAARLRWRFDGSEARDRPPASAREVPLESFMPATDRLVEAGCDRIAYVGTSKGAEAALLVAVRDPRITAVIAFSPASVVWANTGMGRDGAGWPLRSSWTFQGKPLPFVPYDVSKLPAPHNGLMHYRAYYEASLETFADRIPAASIRSRKRGRDHGALPLQRLRRQRRS